MFSAREIAEKFLSRIVTLLIFMLFYLENCEKCNTGEIDSDPTPEIQALYNEYIHI